MRSLRSVPPPRPTKAGVPRPLVDIKTARPVARRSGSPSAQAEPTVLLVGSDAGFEPALRVALARHRVYVETTTADAAVETVIVTAPDLVLLANEAAADGGRALLAKLAASPSSSVVPVAILDDNPALDLRLQAFRHGAAAVIPRSASMDAIAEQIARLAREIPERGGEALGQIGEATLAEFVGALSNQLRSGILSVQTGDASQDPVRLVLGSGRPLAAFIDDFVTRVRRHVVHAEPLKYEFDDRAGGTVQLFDQADLDFEVAAGIKGLRVALADDDSARADSVAQELRARGATVVVTDLNPSEARFARLRQVDPEVLIAGEQHLQGHGYELLRRMRKDTRLRWASLLVVRWEEIWSDTLSVPALDRLESALANLAEADTSLIELAKLSESFDTRLEITGPARLLRALVTTPHAVRMTVSNPRLTVSIDLSEGLVVGASAHDPHDPSQTYDGALALAGMLVLSSGRVQVDPVQQPAVTNVMSTIDVALNMADSEKAPIAPSIPMPHSPSLPPPPQPSLAPPVDELGGSELAAPRPSPAPRLSARKRLGITKPMAAVLVGLACAQGLLLAWFLGSLSKKSHAAEAARASAQVVAAAAPSAAPAATTEAAKPAPPAPAAPAAAVAPAAAAAAMPPPPETVRKAPVGKDESGTVAPTCAALLDPLQLDVGNFPGAAYEQQLAGAKALVQGKVDDAQIAYCKAVRWDAKNPQAHIDLAQLFLIRKDGAAAAEEARNAVELDPNSGRAQSLLGDGLVRIGDHEGAKQAWLLAAGVDPKDTAKFKALINRNLHEAEASLKKKDVSRAERFFRRAIVLEPDSLEASRGLAAVLNQLGDGHAAVRWVQRALAREPRDPDSHVVLGDALLLLGDKPGAEREWREANRLDPSNMEAQRRIRRLRTMQ
ncbi:MAG TPA: tetratricopeptide repeat protein [Polyangiaceae bacterium]|nr:tetratricopeptide repeat protein [Polyangiaceae bacterium]